jgi:hypothetical protein
VLQGAERPTYFDGVAAVIEDAAVDLDHVVDSAGEHPLA